MNITPDRLGQLPFQTENQLQPVERCYQQLMAQKTALQKNRYLHNLSQQHENVFYHLMQKHLKSVLPFLYTPTVGEAVQTFNQNFLRNVGLYLAWPHRQDLNIILDQHKEKPIDIAVLTDGERILGLGDQGVGGIEICIAKSMLYVICAGISPRRILPIYVDFGTNNQALLDDPLYLGWKHQRIQGEEYDNFMEAIVLGLHKRFPNIYIHWEDLAAHNAQRLLNRYRDTLCVFNDDIQGTGLVTCASILNAIQSTESTLEKQRIIIVGAGTAGIGIANQLLQALHEKGLTPTQARRNIWILGRQGLLFEDSEKLTTLQRNYARPQQERAQYRIDTPSIDLLSTVQHIKPTVLIGCSGQAKAFTKNIIKMMAQYVARPIILPLSNPSQYCEARPEQLLHWTEGKALIATGSPFNDVDFKNQQYPIAQCNNALVFPGIGLGVLASGAQKITDKMLTAAYQALCIATQEQNASSTTDRLLPDIGHIQYVTQKIALAVVTKAQEEQVNTISIVNPFKNIQAQRWTIL